MKSLGYGLDRIADTLDIDEGDAFNVIIDANPPEWAKRVAMAGKEP